MWQLGYAVL